MNTLEQCCIEPLKLCKWLTCCPGRPIFGGSRHMQRMYVILVQSIQRLRPCSHWGKATCNHCKSCGLRSTNAWQHQQPKCQSARLYRLSKIVKVLMGSSSADATLLSTICQDQVEESSWGQWSLFEPAKKLQSLKVELRCSHTESYLFGHIK